MTIDSLRTDLGVVPKSEQVLIDFTGAEVTYPGTAAPVIHHADFQLSKGESVLFLGPSGCGKSTFAMLCARLIPQSVEGDVQGVCNWDAELQVPGGIGYVFQDPDAQFCQLTVADEIAFGLENQRVPRAQMDPRIFAALEQAGMAVPLEADHAVFSGGMKQKLAIASALALHPSLLVLDEPTANLDPASTRQVFDLIASLKHAGQTMIVIEHKFDRLLDIMDRVVLFGRDGRIYREGPTVTVMREEWNWLVEQGVIPAWKQNKVVPGLRQNKFQPNQPQANELQANKLQANKDDKNNLRQNAFVLQDGMLSYGEKTVWDHLNLEIPKGSMTAIVGPNGAGKSSLLEVLAGLNHLSAGTLQVLGRDSAKWSNKERFQSISYCFQNPEFQFIYERVGDELANHLVKGSLPARISDLLADFGLAGTEEQSPFALSQGQKRRLSVAAMLREDHEVYLLDEPTFGQDARTQKVIADKLVNLVRTEKTVVFTTHDMDLVREIADQVIVVHDGTIRFAGSPTELFHKTEILDKARLVADTVGDSGGGIDGTSTAARSIGSAAIQEQRPEYKVREVKPTPLTALNPAFFLLTAMAAGIISLWVNTLVSGGLLFALAVVAMLALGRIHPVKIIKWLVPFVFFYLLYIWSFAAYAKVPPGTPTVNFLWVHLSWYGLHQGEVLAVRMLASLGFALLFVFTVEMTRLIVALIVNLRVPPKFAYGTLAGLRVIPLFKDEWTKLRKARQLRGKAGMFWLRPVTYALPLLSQGIRMSERVAIAMEARGFIGPAAASRNQRTYYHPVTLRWYDGAVLLGTIVAASLLLYL